MEEKNVVKFKKNEFTIKEYIKKELGKGKVSKVRVEYTPIGEKIIVSTHKPGLVIGRRGEKIEELTNILKTKFKLENPRIEIDEILKPEFDAQIIADEIALGLERAGPLKFKVIAYRTLQKIIDQGYLKKTGDDAKIVDRATAISQTKPGTVGIKVSILPPEAVFKDRIIIDEEVIANLKKGLEVKEETKEKKK
jgi:small subunit ribosomal protein S3